MSIPKAVVRHTRITFTALYCSKVMYSVGCYVYSSHYRLKKSDKRYFFVLQPSVYMSFNKSVMLVSLFPLSLLNHCKSLIYSCFNCLECIYKITRQVLYISVNNTPQVHFLISNSCTLCQCLSDSSNIPFVVSK